MYISSFGEGEKKGEKKGRKEGMNEKAAAMAKEMKDNGEPIEKIVKYTSLSRENIEKL